MKTSSILAAFIDMMNQIYFPGYVNQMSKAAFDFEFAQFKKMMKK